MGTTYARLALAQQQGAIEGSISGYIEELIASDLGARGVPTPDKPLDRKPKPAEDVHGGGFFTF